METKRLQSDCVMTQAVSTHEDAKSCERTKRQKKGNQAFESSSAPHDSFKSSRSDRNVRGNMLSVLIDNVWKTETLVQALAYVEHLDECSLQEQVSSSCQAIAKAHHVALGDERENVSISSDEALAADLVLDTFSPSQSLPMSSLLFQSHRLANLPMILKSVYGETYLLTLAEVVDNKSLRSILFGGTFRQVQELRFILSDFLGKMVTFKNCLTMLKCASRCSETALYQKAESLFSTDGLDNIVKSNTQGWLVAPLELVVKAVRSAGDPPFQLFCHVASWVKFNCKEPAAINEAMQLLIQYIDMPSMKMKELHYLLNEEPLVQNCTTCIEKLAGAYLSIYTNCAI